MVQPFEPRLLNDQLISVGNAPNSGLPAGVFNIYTLILENQPFRIKWIQGVTALPPEPTNNKIYWWITNYLPATTLQTIQLIGDVYGPRVQSAQEGYRTQLWRGEGTREIMFPYPETQPEGIIGTKDVQYFNFILDTTATNYEFLIWVEILRDDLLRQYDQVGARIND